MRLTFKVATAGQEGITQFPTLPHDSSWYLTKDGKMDVSKIREDFRNTEGVLFSSGDNACIMACALEYLDRIRLTYRRFGETHEGELTEVDVKAKQKKTTCDRRLLEGRVAYIRTDISVNGSGVRIALSYGNPKNVVGDTENFAHTVATTFADILIAMAQDVANENGTRVNLIGGENCKTLFQERMKLSLEKSKREVDNSGKSK